MSPAVWLWHRDSAWFKQSLWCPKTTARDMARPLVFGEHLQARPVLQRDLHRYKENSSSKQQMFLVPVEASVMSRAFWGILFPFVLQQHLEMSSFSCNWSSLDCRGVGAGGEKDKHRGEPWYLGPERTIICMLLNSELISKMKMFCSVSRSLDSCAPYSHIFEQETPPHEQPSCSLSAHPCRQRSALPGSPSPQCCQQQLELRALRPLNARHRE